MAAVGYERLDQPDAPCEAVQQPQAGCPSADCPEAFMSRAMPLQEQDVLQAIVAGTLLPALGDDRAQRMLLIFLPGLAIKPRQYVRLLTLLLGEDCLDNTDLLRFKFNNSYGSRERPADVASRLADEIEKLHQDRDYETVLIVGHSLGALIAR